MQKRTYSVVGMNHTKKEEFVSSLQTGKEVLLVREPQNPYDHLAIGVWIDGERVGYIPKAQNKILAGFIDQAGNPWTEPAKMATDGTTSVALTWAKTTPARFVRSPNSNYPLVEI